MVAKLNCILLVDDDEPTNFLHQRLISRTNCAEETIVARNGQAGLDVIKERLKRGYPQPELILLDINMPIMSGWEFLNAYEELASDTVSNVVIVMLSNSNYLDERHSATKMDRLSAFLTKPLTADLLLEIIDRHIINKS